MGPRASDMISPEGVNSSRLRVNASCRWSNMLLAAVIALTAACTSSDEVRGVVLEVEGTLTSVEWFVLRTDAGDVITMVPSPNGDDTFPLLHLNDHRSTLSPIIVVLDRSVDPPVARSIRDAEDADEH